MIGGGLFRTPPVLTNDNSLATIGCSRFLKTYSTETGKLLSSVHAHRSLIVAVHRNPFSDRHVISTSKEGEVKYWSLTNRRFVLVKSWNLQTKIFQSKIPNSKSNDCLNVYVFTRLKQRLVINKYQLKMNNNDDESGTKDLSVKVVAKIFEPKKRADFVSFEVSDDETDLIWVSKAFLYVYNMTSARKPRRKRMMVKGSEAVPTCVSYHSESKSIAIGTATGQIKIFTLPQLLLRKTHWHPVEVHYIQFSEDGSCLYSGGRSGVLLSQNLHVSSIGYRFVFLRDYPILDFVVSPNLDLYLIRTEENLIYIVHPSRYNQAHLGRSAISRRIVGLLPTSGPGQLLHSCPPNFRDLSHTSPHEDDDDDDQVQNVKFYRKQVMVTGHHFHKMQWFDVSKDGEAHHEMLFFHRKSFDSREHGFKNRKMGRKVQLTNISFSSSRDSRKWYVHAEKIRPGKFFRDSVNIKIWFRKNNIIEEEEEEEKKRRREDVMSRYRVVSVIDRPHGENNDVSDLITLPPLRNQQQEQQQRRRQMMFASSGNDGCVKLWKFVGSEEEEEKKKMLKTKEKEDDDDDEGSETTFFGMKKPKKKSKKKIDEEIVIIDEEEIPQQRNPEEQEKKKSEKMEDEEEEEDIIEYNLEDDEDDEKRKSEGYFQCIAVLKYQNFVPSSLVGSEDGSTLFVLFGDVFTIWNIENCTLVHSIKIPFSPSSTKQLMNDDDQEEEQQRKKTGRKILNFTDSKILVWGSNYSFSDDKNQKKKKRIIEDELFLFDFQSTCSFSPPIKLINSTVHDIEEEEDEGEGEEEKKKKKKINNNNKIKDIICNPYIEMNKRERKTLLIEDQEKKRVQTDGEILVIMRKKKYLSLIREITILGGGGGSGGEKKPQYEVKKIELKKLMSGSTDEYIESATYLSETQICVLTNHAELINFDFQEEEKTAKASSTTSTIEIEYQKDSELVSVVVDDNEDDEEDDFVMKEKRGVEVDEQVKEREKRKRVKFNPDKGLGGWKELFPPNSHSISSLSSVYESYMQNFVIGK